MTKNGQSHKGAYGVLKNYMTLLVNKFYYSKTYCINPDNVPAKGTPLIIVSNHQNCLNDAFAIIFSITDRKVKAMVRADVFSRSPLLSKFLTWVGLTPAFRMSHEGEEALQNNTGSFDAVEQELLNGETVVIFPEAGHQDRRWLGTYASGYTKIAFETAQKTGFEKEIFILPSCNHYSGYFFFRNQMLVRYGKPISIKPYYDLYKERPRTAQREVNRIVRSAVSEMMLDIRDTEHYDEIDFIREKLFGKQYAESCGLDPNELPQKLEADKKLVAALAEASENGRLDGFYGDVRKLREDIAAEGISVRSILSDSSSVKLILECAMLVILLPLALSCALPFAICSAITLYLYKAGISTDRMFEGTFVILSNAFVTLPLLAIIALVTGWAHAGILGALVSLAMVPLSLCFEWFYIKKVKKVFEDAKWQSLRNGSRGVELKNRVNTLIDRLKSIVNR